MIELISATEEHYPRLQEIYLEAFPRAERKPFSAILRMQRQGIGDILAIMAGDALVGLATVIFKDDLVLLDYFAMDAACRGQGHGSAALQALLLRYPGKRFFLEIEESDPAAQNALQREKRKAFYLRHGLAESGMRVRLFGVEMEILTYECGLTFAEYHALYVRAIGKWLAGRMVKELA